MGLLIDHGGPHLGDVVDAEVADELEGLAGVGDVVGDQDLLVGEVDRVGNGSEHDGHVEGGAHARVELDVHQVEVLAVEGVGEAAGHEDAAAGDAEDDVGLVPVVGDGLREFAHGGAEGLVGQVLPYAAHAAAVHGAITPVSGGS